MSSLYHIFHLPNSRNRTFRPFRCPPYSWPCCTAEREHCQRWWHCCFSCVESVRTPESATHRIAYRANRMSEIRGAEHGIRAIFTNVAAITHARTHTHFCYTQNILATCSARLRTHYTAEWSKRRWQKNAQRLTYLSLYVLCSFEVRPNFVFSRCCSTTS